MNRIFKVLWNKSLKRFVVTNEVQRSRRKAKNETIAIGATLLALLPLPLDSVFASDITKPDGWSNTTISTSGNVTNITNPKVQGDIGIHRFSKFNVTAGNIANLHLADGTNNLVNFVNDSINIDGTVNSLKGSNVGGNLFFVTPSGMTVGATGVINAGSLTSIVSTEAAFKEWTGDISKVDSTLLNKMQSGAVPLNRTGVITVNGSINTGNRIVLAASEINIGSTATLTNKRALSEFKTLVNIGASSGVGAVSAGVDGTLEARETADGSGDILLLARSDTSGSSDEIEANVNVAGKVYSREDIAVGAMAGNGTYDEEKNTFADSSVSSTATIKASIDVSGTVEAAQDAAIKAQVINHVQQGGTITTIKDLTLAAIGATTGINEDASYANLTSVATVTVAQGASIRSGKDLTIQAQTDTLLNVGASLVSLQLLDTLKDKAKRIPAAAAVVALIDTSSSVVINGSLTTGGDLTIGSSDTLNGTASAVASHALAIDENPGHIAFTYAKFDGSSHVTVSEGATIKLNQKSGSTTAGKVSITATRESRVDTSADATVERAAYGAIAFNYTEHNTSSSVTMNAGLSGASAESLTIASENITKRESMYAQTRSGPVDGMKVKLAGIVKGFSEGVVSGLMGNAAQGINNNFTAQTFKAGGTVGIIAGNQSSSVTIAPSTTFKSAGNVVIESLSKKYDHHYTVYAQSDGVKSGDNNQDGEVKKAGSIGLLISVPTKDDTVTSDLTIGDEAEIVSTAGTLTINNTAEISYNRVKVLIEDLLEKVDCLKDIYTSHNKSGTDWAEVQKAVDALKTATSEDQNVETLVKYTGSLIDRLKTAFSNTRAVVESFDQVYDLVVNACQFIQMDSYVNSYVTASGSADQGKLEFGGALGVLIASTSSNLSIGKGAKLTVGTAGSTQKGELTVVGASINESVALSGHIASTFGIALPTVTNSDAFGASVLIQSLSTNNTVTIREGAQLKDLTGIGSVKVAASDRIENVTIGASADSSQGNFGISVNAALAMSTGVNRLRIDDEATISAGSVSLQANRQDNNQAIVGTLSVGSNEDTPSKNVGASVAVNLIDFKNTLAIEDNDALDGGTNKYNLTGLIEAKNTTDGAVDISAHEDTTLNAIGLSGGISTSGKGEEEEAEEDENPNILKRFSNWLSQKVDSTCAAINNAFDQISDSAPGWGNAAGKAIRNGVKKVLKQNAEGNVENGDVEHIADPENNPGNNMVDENGNAAVADNDVDPMDGEQARHFQIGLAASVGWNHVILENTVTINADKLTIAAPKLNVEAVTDKWIGAWAGGAAISYVNCNDARTSSSAGAGGAIAVNSGTLTNLVTIGKNLTLDTNVESVTIRAVNCGTIVAEGLSAGIAASSSEEAGSQYSFDASASVNLLENTVRTDVSSVTQKAGTKALSWDQASFNGETQVTGGTGFGLSLQKGEDSARSVGLIVAYAEIDNTVESKAQSLTLAKASQFYVKALTNVSQVTTAIGANVTTGDSSTSFTGAAGATNFVNTVNSEVSGSTITLSDGAATQIVASGITDEDAETYKALSEWKPESKASEREGLSSELDNSSFYNGVILKTDKNQTNSEDGQKLSELGKKTGLHQTTVVVSAAVSVKKGAGGAAIALNTIDNNFTTSVSSTSFKKATGASDVSFTQRAEGNVTSVAVSSGIAASPSGNEDDRHYALAGSLIVSNVDQKSISTLTGSTIVADSVAIESADKATTVNVAGGVELSLGGNGSAAGAALVVMNTNNRAEVSILNNSTIEAGTLSTRTLNKANAWGVSVDVAATQDIGFGGSLTVNRVKNESLITVNRATLKDFTSADFSAEDTSQLWTLAGAVAFGSERAGLSGAVGYSISGRDGSVGTKVDVTDLTVQKTKGKATGSLGFKANATDKTHTLVLAAGVSTQGTIGFGGAAGVGEVKRDTIATVKNLKTVMLSDTDGSEITDNTDSVLGALAIEATETSGVYNLGIAGAYGDSAGIGLGVAVNRINVTTEATLTADAGNASRIKAGSLKLMAKTAEDIENIAIGGSGAQSFALTGSVAFNKLTDNTKTKLENVQVDVAGAALVNAQSDDVIGSYVGQIAGSSTAAGGLSLLINERFGDTKTEVTSSEIKQTQSASESMTVKGGVKEDKINKHIVNDISTEASLEDDREEITVEGIYIGATSTATFKSFVINGAGAGTGSGSGSGTVTYHGGATKTVVTSSTLEALRELTIESGDFANVDNILTVAAFAGTGAGELAINVATTDHETATSIDGGSLSSSAGAVKANAQAKEGVSSIAIAGAGSGTGAGGVLVNVTRELSKVTTEISTTTQTAITGKSVEATSDYLGRFNALAISGDGAGVGAGNINVIVNYSDNAIKTAIGKAQIQAIDSVTISSLRRTENSGIDIAGSGALYGGMSATILVNTVEGSSTTSTSGANILGQTLSDNTEAEPTIAITSDGEDVFDLVGVTATGALYGSAGALVSVNRFLAKAQTTVDASTITGSTVAITAAQNRDIDATNVFASLSIGTLGANVLATVVGAGGDPFATEDTKLTALENQVKSYTETYAGSSSKEAPGIFSKVITGSHNTLTEAEKAEMIQAAAKSAAKSDQVGGTHVKVTGSTITAKSTELKDTLKIMASEDTASWAKKKITVGNGELAGGVFAGSVATLREKRNLTTEIAGSTLTATSNALIGTQIGGTSELNSIQTILAGAAAVSAYVDVDIQGGSNVVLDAVKVSVGTSGKESSASADDSTQLTDGIDGELHILSEDDSKTEGYSFGLDIAGVSGAGIVANADDKSSVAINISNNSTITGIAQIEAIRATVRKSEVKAGTAGALNGTGALATVTDTGGAKVSIAGLTSSGKSIEVLALNKADLYTRSYQGYASAITIGVLKATTKASGETSLTVSSSTLNSDVVELNASTGTVSYDTDDKLIESDALFLTSQVYSYGASIVGGFVGNNAVAENTTTTNLTVKDNIYGSQSSLLLSEYGFAYYDVYSDLGTGGAVAEGASYANINHAAKLTNTIVSHGSGNDVGLFLFLANNIEEGTLKAYSAGGSVIDMSAKAAHVEHKDTSSITSTLSGSWNASLGILISSASTHKLDFLADNTRGVVIGGSSAQLDNSMNGSNTLTISGDFSSDESFYASAVTNIDLGAIEVEGKTYAVDTAVYGAINGANGRIGNTVARDTIVNISENSSITAETALNIASQTIEKSSLRVRARTAGVAAGVTAYNDNTIVENTLINLKKGVKLTNLDSDYDVTLSASNSATRVIEAIGDLQGAVFGGAGAKSVNSVTQTNEVTTEANSKITGAGKVNLYAGRDILGEEEDFDFSVYTHAYAHSIGGTDNELNDSFAVTNRLTLSGDVLAVRSIDATADIGTWNLSEISRYWEILSSKDAATLVRIASSAEGKKSEGVFKPVNSIVLNGTLTAGTQTKSVIVLKGLVDRQGGQYTIEGATADKATEEISGIELSEGTITYDTESVANLYKERYETLLSLIADFRGSDGDGTAVLSYRKEAEILKQKMIDQGLAIFDNEGNIISLIEKDWRGVVKVSGITVAGGDVNLRADSVTGAGAITANAAETITIDNQTNLALTVENVRILEKGGNLTLNGLAVSDKPDQFSGSVKSAATADDPTVKITSKYSGGKIKMTAKNGDEVIEKEITPDNTITVKGIVANDAGSLTMSAVGDIFVGGDKGTRLAAATSLSLSATRSVMQSYTKGIKEVAGGIESLWKEAVEKIKGGSETSYNTGEEALSPDSEGIIAGEDLFISADNINLNGLVQSGYATWSLDIAQSELETKISEIKRKWRREGSKSDINPMTSAYQISEGGHYKKEDGTYGMKVAAWYDPVNDRVIVDDIKPQGGRIYLTGRISSTGGGKIYAASGTADVSINSGNHSVRLGEITTQNGNGLIEITDTTAPGASTSTSGSKAVAKVYRWENDGATTTHSAKILYQDGTLADLTDATITDTSFTPTAGLSYVWSDGYRTGTVETKETKQHFLWWSAWDSGDPSTWTTETTTQTLDNEALGSGMTLDVGLHKDSNYKFNSWVTTTTKETGEWKKTDWVTYDNWTHFSGDNHSKAVRTSTGTKIYTYSVKADEKVDVGFLTASNKVDVTSGVDIVLGGKVNAEKGTVNFTATRDILNDANGVAYVDASTVTLNAGGSIGEAGSSLRVFNSVGDLNLSATGSLKGSIYIDASTKSQSGFAVNASSLKAGSVNLTAQEALNVTNLTAYEANLLSNAGDIVVSSLDQMNAEDDTTRRFDATASAGSVSLNATDDISVGKIQAKETVTVTSTAGNVWDALPREDLDNRNAEERIRLWKEAGILGDDGANNGSTRWSEDVATQEAIVKSDFSRYQSYQEMSSLSDAQAKDFESLKARFAGVESAEAALEKERANGASNLAQTIAAKDDYGWSQTELLYAVSKAITNPDSGTVPEAGEPNITAKKVVINANKSAGKELNKQTIQFSDINATTTAGIEAYKILARADVGDVTWGATSVDVELKRPISVKLTDETTGELDGKASVGFYVASDEKLRVGTIEASGATVRLTSGKGIEAVAEQQNILANNLTLRGGVGGIGLENTPIQIHTTGDVALSAEQGIYIKELNGELKIVSASTKDVLDLSADKIVSVPGDGYLTAKSIVLRGNDENSQIGTQDQALKIKAFDDGNTSVTIKSAKLNTFNVEILGDAGYQLNLENNALETTETLTLTGEGNLTIDKDTTFIAGSTLTLESKKTLTIEEGSSLQSNDIDLKAESGDVVAEGVSFKPTDAAADASVSVVSTLGDVSLKNSSFKGENITLDVSADQGSVDLSRTDTTAVSTLKNLKVDAKNEINVAGSNIKTTDSMVLHTSGTVLAEKATLESGGAMEIEGQAKVNLNGATLKSTSTETLKIASEAGALEAKNSTIESTGSIDVNAAKDVNFRDATISAQSGKFSISSKQTVYLDSEDETKEITAQEIAIDANNVIFNKRKATATGTMTVNAKNAIAGAASNLTAGKMALNAAGLGMNLENATLKSTTEDLSLVAASGVVDAKGANIEANTVANVKGSSGVTLTDATVKSVQDSVAVTVTNGALESTGATYETNHLIALEAKTNANLKDAAVVGGASEFRVTTTTGNIDLSTSNHDKAIAVKTLTLNAGSNVNLGSRDVETSDALSVKAKGDIEVDSTLTSQSTLNLEAVGSILANQSTMRSDKTLTLSAQNGNLQAQGATLESKASNIEVNAAKDVNLRAASIAAQNGKLAITSKETVYLEAEDSTQEIAAQEIAIDANNVILNKRKATATGTMTVNAKNAIAGAASNLTAGKMALDAAGLGMNLENATLKSTAEDLALTSASGLIDAKGASIESNTAAKVEGSSGVILTDATVKSVQDSVAVTVTNGALESTGATYETNHSVTLEAKNDANLKDAAFSENIDLNITSKTGDIDLSTSNHDKAIAVKNLKLDSGSDVKLVSRDISTTQAFDVNAKGSIVADSTLTSQTTLNLQSAGSILVDQSTITSEEALTLQAQYGRLQAQGATLESKQSSVDVKATGNVDLKDAKVAAENSTIHIESSAGKMDLSATNSERTLKAQSIVIDAVSALDMNSRTIESTDTLTVNANGIVTAKAATLQSEGALTLNARRGMDLSESNVTTQSNLSLNSSKGYIKASSATLTSPNEIAITANGDVSFSGTSSLTAPKVSMVSNSELIDLFGSAKIDATTIQLIAEKSDIFLADDVQLIAKESVELGAGAGILQVDRSVITAPELTVLSGDAAIFDSKLGNQVPKVVLNSIGEIDFKSAVDTTVTINPLFLGIVFGDVWLDTGSNALTITNNELDVLGQFSAHARTFKVNDVVSFDGFYVSTLFNGDATTDSIEVGEITSTEIGLMTDKGFIKAKNLYAFDGSVCVYRTSLDTQGNIEIGDSGATSNGFIYNGNGNINSGLVSDQFTQIVIGRAGTITQTADAMATPHYVIRGMTQLTDDIKTMTVALANEHKWFPMMDWQKAGMNYIARSTDEIWEVYRREKKHLDDPYDHKEHVIIDNWTKTFDPRRIEGVSEF